jgi:streptogramin lyase
MCPAADNEIYVTATGGTVGQSTDTGGAQMVLLSVLGPCNSITSSTSVTINEVSTVAASYALAGFVGPGAQIGTSPANSRGLANAFANVANLIDLSTGTAPGRNAPAGAVVPVAKLNSLAGILSNCVSSVGGAICDSLFAGAVSAAGIVPSNTLDAMLNIVRDPEKNVAPIFALAPASSPFQPVLKDAPPDWTMAISYSGGGLNGPAAIALDSTGSIWVADYYDAVTKLAPTGAPLSPAAGYTGGGLSESYGLAVDANDNVWISNEASSYAVNGGKGSVTELSSSGQFLSGASGYSQGGVDFPDALAVDSNGYIWVANDGDSSASLLNENGVAVSGSAGYGSGSMSFPAAVAIDGNHNAWYANQGSSTITEISVSGSVLRTVSCCEAASGIAVDQFNNLWVANYFGNSVSQVTTSGTLVSSGYTAESVNQPNVIAVYGAVIVWVTNNDSNSIAEILGASTAKVGTVAAPAKGYGSDAGLNEPYGIAIDASGNVWVSNFASNTVTNFLGLATPTKTPSVGLPGLP